jgi:hypothetical protein
MTIPVIEVPEDVLSHMHKSVFKAFTRLNISRLNTQNNEFYLVSQNIASEIPLKRVDGIDVPDERYVVTIKNNYAKTIVHAKGLANVRNTLIKYQNSYTEMDNLFVIEHDKLHKGVNLMRHCKDLFLKYSDCTHLVKCEYNNNIDNAYEGRV